MNPALLAARMAYKTDLAGDAALMRPERWKAYRLAWALDESAETRSAIYGMLMNEAARLSVEGGYEYPKGLMERLVNLAIDELKHPIPSDAWHLRAERVGLGRAAWFKTWAKRYEAIHLVIKSWESEGFRHVWRKQRG